MMAFTVPTTMISPPTLRPPPPPTSTAAPPGGPVAGRPAPVRLVLFVGEGLRPGGELAPLLGREGIRSLWLPGVPHALRAASMACFDAVLVDGTLVHGRSARAIPELAETLRCPVLVVGEAAPGGGSDDEVDEIVALELGADAYLRRPLAPRRLRAHLSAVMRRPRGAEPAAEPALASPPRVGGWELDTVRGLLRHDGPGRPTVVLTPLLASLLHVLLETPGRLVPRARLAAALPQGERLNARSVDVYVHRLRQRLREHGVDDLLVESQRGRGYAVTLADLAAAA